MRSAKHGQIGFISLEPLNSIAHYSSEFEKMITHADEIMSRLLTDAKADTSKPIFNGNHYYTSDIKVFINQTLYSVMSAEFTKQHPDPLRNQRQPLQSPGEGSKKSK